jgi:hypothetical protein
MILNKVFIRYLPLGFFKVFSLVHPVYLARCHVIIEINFGKIQMNKQKFVRVT